MTGQEVSIVSIATAALRAGLGHGPGQEHSRCQPLVVGNEAEGSANRQEPGEGQAELQDFSLSPGFAS